jgi:hypothetical protein
MKIVLSLHACKLYQQTPMSFTSFPGNKWAVRYRDSTGNGTIELETVKRDFQVFAGFVDSTEYYLQVRASI